LEKTFWKVSIKISEKLQNPDLGVYERYLLLSSLNKKLMEYEAEAIKMND